MLPTNNGLPQWQLATFFWWSFCWSGLRIRVGEWIFSKTVWDIKKFAMTVVSQGILPRKSGYVLYLCIWSKIICFVLLKVLVSQKEFSSPNRSTRYGRSDHSYRSIPSFCPWGMQQVWTWATQLELWFQTKPGKNWRRIIWFGLQSSWS